MNSPLRQKSLAGSRKMLVPALAALALAFSFSPVVPGRAAPEEPSPKTQVTELLRQPDPQDATREIVLLSVKFPPGTNSQPHRHPGFIVGYVLSGELEFQLEGQPLQRFKPGDRFYEPPMSAHMVSRNPGTGTTEILAFTVQEKGKPIVLPLH